MRTLIYIIFYFITGNAWGYNCPTYITTNTQAKIIHTWLNDFKHVSQIHGCEIELVACNFESGEFDDSSPIGEALITTKKGRTGYIQISFPKDEREIPFAKSEMKSGRGYLNYHQWDYNNEPTEGAIQKWNLNFTKKKYKKNSMFYELEQITLGIYSHNRQLNQSNGNDSRWFICLPSKGD